MVSFFLFLFILLCIGCWGHGGHVYLVSYLFFSPCIMLRLMFYFIFIYILVMASLLFFYLSFCIKDFLPALVGSFV